MKYIYLQRYIKDNKDYFYVGKHQWQGQGVDPDYHGSGSRLKSYTWVSQSLLEDTTLLSDEEHAQREVYWINYYASLFGVVPFYVGEHYDLLDFAKNIRPDGRLLNCHASLAGKYVGSGLWCLDESPNLYTLPEISSLLDKPRSSVPATLANLSLDNAADQFFYHGHWIHRPGVVKDTNAPAQRAIHDRDKSTYKWNTPEVYAKIAKTRAAKGSNVKAHKAMASPESIAKAQATKREKLPVYRLSDGFEGNYFDIEAHTGCNHTYISVMLRGKKPIPQKWSILNDAILLS